MKKSLIVAACILVIGTSSFFAFKSYSRMKSDKKTSNKPAQKSASPSHELSPEEMMMMMEEVEKPKLTWDEIEEGWNAPKPKEVKLRPATGTTGKTSKTSVMDQRPVKAKLTHEERMAKYGEVEKMVSSIVGFSTDAAIKNPEFFKLTKLVGSLRSVPGFEKMGSRMVGDKVLGKFIDDKLAQVKEPPSGKMSDEELRKDLEKIDADTRKRYGEKHGLADLLRMGHMHELANRYDSAKEYDKVFAINSGLRDLFYDVENLRAMFTQDMVLAACKWEKIPLAINTATEYCAEALAGEADYDRLQMFFSHIPQRAHKLNLTPAAIHAVRMMVYFKKPLPDPKGIKLSSSFKYLDPELEIMFAHMWPQGNEKDQIWFDYVARCWRGVPAWSYYLSKETKYFISQKIEKLQKEDAEKNRRNIAGLYFLAGDELKSLELLASSKEKMSEDDYGQFAKALLLYAGDPRVLDPQSGVLKALGLEEKLTGKLLASISNYENSSQIAELYKSSFLVEAAKDCRNTFQSALSNPPEDDKNLWCRQLQHLMGTPLFEEAMAVLLENRKLDDTVLANLENYHKTSLASRHKQLAQDWQKLLALQENLGGSQRRHREFADSLSFGSDYIKTVKLEEAQQVAESLEKEGSEGVGDTRISDIKQKLAKKLALTKFRKQYISGNIKPDDYSKIRNDFPDLSLRGILQQTKLYPYKDDKLAELSKKLKPVLVDTDKTEMKFIHAEILAREKKCKESMALLQELCNCPDCPVKDYELDYLSNRAFPPLAMELLATEIAKPEYVNSGIGTLGQELAKAKLTDEASKSTSNTLKFLSDMITEAAEKGQVKEGVAAFRAIGTIAPTETYRTSMLEKLYEVIGKYKEKLASDIYIENLAMIASELPKSDIFEKAYTEITGILKKPTPEETASAMCDCGTNIAGGKYARMFDYHAATYLYRNERYEQSIEQLDKYIATYGDPDDRSLFLRGLCYLKTSKTEEAQKDLDKLIATYPDSQYEEKALFLLGWANLTGGEKTKAAQYYRKVVEKYPNTEFGKRAKAFLVRLEQDLSASAK